MTDIEAPDKETRTVAPEKNDQEEPFDAVRSSIGSFGRWQLYICLVISLIKIPGAWHLLAIVFLAPPVDFWCADGRGLYSSDAQGAWMNHRVATYNERCYPGGIACERWEYNRSVFTSTIATEWDLVCDKAPLANLAQTVFMFGVLLGNVFFGMAADKYGRKNPLIASVVLQVAAGVATAFAPWYSLLLVFRFLDALATGGQMITSFVICLEIVSKKWRTIVAVAYHIPFSMGHSSLALLSYFFRSWRNFQLAISLPTILMLSYWWLVPESPRWLLAVGREEEATKILEKAAAKNKRDPGKVAAGLKAHMKKQEAKPPEPAATILDLFRTPNLRTKTICIYLNWLVCGLCFFGLAQYMGHVGGNIFINIAISGLIEMPGTFGCMYSMDRFGRRNTLAGAQFIAGTSCLLLMTVTGVKADWPRVTLAALGIVGMSISFPTVYLFSGELFPTVVRNVGVGSASMCARIGSMLAPFVTSLDQFSLYLPPLLLGIMPIIGGLLCFLLPETAWTALPDTIEEGESFGKRSPKKKKGEVNNHFQPDEGDAATKL